MVPAAQGLPAERKRVFYNLFVTSTTRAIVEEQWKDLLASRYVDRIYYVAIAGQVR